MKQFQTLKADLTQTRIIENDTHPPIEGNDIVVRIQSFAFTANNLTYGVAGDSIGYWKFFPALNNESGYWGCIPTWGFAEITYSKDPNLLVGERIFGYFPAADYLTLQPAKVTEHGFFDGSAHRSDLPPVYNNYVRLSGEDNYDPAMDNIRALLFPLHITSFCLCDALAMESYYGASQVLVISASSKTGLGLAQGLADEENPPTIVGLTAEKNVSFVRGLGCYNQVLSYNDIYKLDPDLASVIVDMSGNKKILGTLNTLYGEHLLRCLTVGMTHWNQVDAVDESIDPPIAKEKTEFFFAPGHIQKRLGDWGRAGYQKKTDGFMNARGKQSHDWMSVREISGLESFADLYSRVVKGDLDPSEGIIVKN